MTRLFQIAVAVFVVYEIYPLFTNFVTTMHTISNVMG